MSDDPVPLKGKTISLTTQRQKARQVIGAVAPIMEPLRNIVEVVLKEKRSKRKVSEYYAEQAKLMLKAVQDCSYYQGRVACGDGVKIAWQEVFEIII